MRRCRAITIRWNPSCITGEGAYDGLIALWEEVGHWDACSWDVRGLIVEGEPPAVPEPFTGE